MYIYIYINIYIFILVYVYMLLIFQRMHDQSRGTIGTNSTCT